MYLIPLNIKTNPEFTHIWEEFTLEASTPTGMIDTGEQRQTGRKRTESHRKEPKESKQLPSSPDFWLRLAALLHLILSAADGRIFACPIKMLPRGEAETQTQVSSEAELHSGVILFWNTKAGVYPRPGDFNDLRFSSNSTATFSWQMRLSFTEEATAEADTAWPTLARKYTCLVQGWATIQAWGQSGALLLKAKNPLAPFQLKVRFQPRSWCKHTSQVTEKAA